MKNKLISIMAAICMLIGILPQAAFASGGTGTETDPYLISTAQELKEFAAKVNGGEKNACAKLTADIDLNNAAWTTICETGLYHATATYADTGYSGTFDGAGYTISNLALVTSSTRDSSCGLFGTVSGTIKNLRINGAKILTDGGKDMRTGAIVGQLITTNGLVTDCIVTNALITPTPSEHVNGGIAGAVYEGRVENCMVYNSTVTGTNNRYGRIVGDTRGDIKVSSGTDRPGTVTNCYTDGTPVASGQSGNITDCKGSITTEQFASGEIAVLLQGDRTDTVWGQLLTTDAYPSLGSQNRVYYGYTDCIHKEYSNTKTDSSVTPPAHNYAGGICTVCGCNESGSYVIDTADRLMEFASRVNSGETGLNAIMTADVSFSTENVFTPIGTSENQYRGTFDGQGHTLTLGITGDESTGAPFSYATGATIKNLTTAGAITANGKYAAGFVSRANNITLEKCISKVKITSSVSGDGTHGGLIGTVNGSADTPTTITNCGFAGEINGSGTNSCGGLVGWTDQNTKTNISSSYVAGKFTVSANSSDTFSRNPNYSALTNCYYLTKLNSVKTGATQLTSEQFASGEAAWKLNGEKANGAWKQTIGTDAYPSFAGNTVYKNTCGGKPLYANDQTSYDAHDFVDGVCSHCGTLEEPPSEEGVYQISTANQLVAFAELVNSGQTGISGKLMNNIDLSTVCGANINGTEKNWTPIGNSTNSFTGKFDGQGHTISGLYINNTAANNQGLFGYTESATIQNLAVVGEVSGKFYVGGVVGYNTSGTVTNCSFSGNVSGQDSAGGVVGYKSQGTISNCYNTGTVSSKEVVGGVVGNIHSGTVINCSFSGKVSGQYTVGGVVGYTFQGTVSNCYNTGTVSGTVSGRNYVGGVVGDNDSGTVTNCYYLDTAATGGINGSDTEGQAEKKTADEFASGEVAYLLQGTQETSVWGQSVSGTDKDTTPVLVSYLKADQQMAKQVHKVTFVQDAATSTVLYANPSGVGADRMPTEPAAPEGYALRWAQSEIADAFTGTTPVTADITLNAYKQEKYGEQDNDKTVTTTYGTEVTKDLSTYVGYAGATEAAGKFDYAINGEYNHEYFSISGDTLTVTNIAPAGEYSLSITATEKAPQISTFALNNVGTEPVTFTVTVKVNKANSVVVTAPAAKATLVSTGTAQELVTAGTAQGGTMMYSLDGVNYSENIPTGTEAGTYTVYYKIVGDDNHNDTESATVSVTMLRRYINTVQKKITKEDTKDNSEATAVLSQINMNGNAISNITWTYTAADNSEYTAKYTQQISGESTVYFGIVVPALLKAQENQTTDEIKVNIE